MGRQPMKQDKQDPFEFSIPSPAGGMLTFKTDQLLFSPKGPDPGTMEMLKLAVPFITAGSKVLDLGCGYGLVGIYAAALTGPENVVMSDISDLALELSAENCRMNGFSRLPKIVESRGFAAIDDTAFDLILSNPPYHADFSVPKEFIEKGFNRLAVGGRLFMVTKRLDWYRNKIAAIFGGVRVFHTNGYCVFMAEKRKYKRGRQ